MIIPGRTLITLAILVAAGLLCAVIWPAAVVAAVIADLVLLGLLLGFGWKLRRAELHIEREGWQRMELNVPRTLVYRLENLSRHRLVVHLRQHWPAEVVGDEDALQVSLGPNEVVRIGLLARGVRRGRAQVPAPTVDVRFTLDLARHRRRPDVDATLSVYPNLRAIAQYDTLRRNRALNQMGLHRQRRRGAGREFDQLREYLPDDDYREIDWKATARRGTPITTMYRPERSQDVFVCLETGRMMGNPIGGATALDHAVNAAVLLGHVCVRSGDRLGLVLFRDVVTNFIRPAAGAAVSKRVLESLVDATVEPVFPSYAALAASLQANQKQRSMVFLFTDLNDPQLAENLRDVVRLISRRHVFVVVSLFDPLTEQVASGASTRARGLYQIHAARRIVDDRRRRIRELQRAGVLVLEADAGSITIDVINRYLAVKSQQLV